MSGKWFVTKAVLAAGAFCVPGCKDERPPAPPPTKPAASKPAALTLEQARDLATRLANEAFAGQQFVSPSGERVFIKARFRPTSWRKAELENGYWVFVADPPTGPQAEVTFRPDGTDPRVDVGFVFE